MAVTTRGNCYLCGAELGKVALKNHILKMHNGAGLNQECVLLKVEGAYDKDYWLYLDIPVNDTLQDLDQFLRDIWLECCGHMSAFRADSKLDYIELDMEQEIGSFPAGEKFRHEYDFGDTTETLITVLGRIRRAKQKESVRLLGRNIPPKFKCCQCGADAAYICTMCMYETEEPFFCESCADQHTEHEEMLLPVTNSPRLGVCGYCGERDKFAFVPFGDEKA